MYLTSM